MVQKLYDIIKDKVFFSKFSGAILEVVREIPEVNDGKSYFNGMTMVDGVKNVEDDIQQVTSITKNGKTVNLEDYYRKNGALKENDEEKFIAALNRLMTQEEYKQYQIDGLNTLTFDKTRTILKKCTDYKVERVVIPRGVTTIANSAFRYCSKLTNITIPDSVILIERNAFYGCFGLTSIKLPESLTEIGDYAFENCI